MSLRAGVLLTGTELLSGQLRDRNGPWLAERFGELGVEVSHLLTVGDRPEDLERALRFLAAEGVGLIVTSGGLGPTADDLTAEVVARFTGRELALDPDLEAKIDAIVSAFARRMKMDPASVRAANRKQAMVPEGAVVIDPVGTAPGLVVPADGVCVVVLPGPPRELQPMWAVALETEPVREALAGAGKWRTSSLRMFGLAESELAQGLEAIGAELDLGALEVTTCLRDFALEIDVRYQPGSEAAVDALRQGLIERFGRYLFSEGAETVDEIVARLLDGRRIGVAESCSGGLLAARLTRTPGASAYLMGGVVAYSNQAKVDLLGVAPELIERHGAVSPEVAEAMADGALARFDADVACSITGVAGPDGGTKDKPVGYVCLCAKLADGTKLVRDPVLPGRSRDDVRERSAAVAMHLIRMLLQGLEPPL